MVVVVSDIDRELAEAVLGGDPAQVRRVLEAGASPDARSPGGWPLLVSAAADGRGEVVTILLNAGAEVGATAEPDHTALHAAAASGCVPCIDALLLHGADPSAVDGAGRTPLHVAVLNAPPEVVARLAPAAPDTVVQRDRRGRSPVDDAIVHRLSAQMRAALGAR